MKIFGSEKLHSLKRNFFLKDSEQEFLLWMIFLECRIPKEANLVSIIKQKIATKKA